MCSLKSQQLIRLIFYYCKLLTRLNAPSQGCLVLQIGRNGLCCINRYNPRHWKPVKAHSDSETFKVFFGRSIPFIALRYENCTTAISFYSSELWTSSFTISFYLTFPPSMYSTQRKRRPLRYTNDSTDRSNSHYQTAGTQTLTLGLHTFVCLEKKRYGNIGRYDDVTQHRK